MSPRYLSSTIYTSRDRRAFFLLWQAKLLSTAAIARWVYPTSPVEVVYKRLRKLERRGWLTQRVDRNGRNWYWTLTKQNYRQLRPELPELHDKGFETEFVDHDAAASAIHLSVALAYRGDPMHHITEQWMRRVDYDSWHEPIPQRLGHRPDGYWVQNAYADDPYVVALEYERQPKPLATYRERFWNYQREPSVHRVLWVCADEAILRRLAKTLFALEAESETKHSLFLWSDFVNDGIHMRPRRGIDTDKALAQLVSRAVSRWSLEPVHRYFVDGSRTGKKSLPYRLAAKAAGLDCIPPPRADGDTLCTDPCRLPEEVLPSPQSDRSLKTETQPAGETPQGEDPWQS